MCPEEGTFEGTEIREARKLNTFFEFEREGFKVLQKFSAEPSELRFTYTVDELQKNLFLKCDKFPWFLGRRARRFGLFAKSILLELSKNFSRAQNYALVVTSVWRLGFVFQTSSKNIRVHCENL